MNNKPFSPVEAMQATQDAHDKAYGVFKADETMMNNKHQELTDWKVAELSNKIWNQSGNHTHDKLDEMITKILTDTIDTVLTEEREKWVKAVGEKIDKTTQELMLSSFQEGVSVTKAQYDEALKNLAKNSG